MTPRVVTAAPSPEPRTVELIVEIDALPASVGERLRDELEAPIVGGLETAGFEVVEAGSDTDVVLRLRMPDVESRTYELSFAVIEAGEMQTVVEAVICEVCAEQDVIDRALELLPAVTALLAVTPAPAEEIECEAVVEPPEVAPVPVPVPGPDHRGVGGLGTGGAALMGVGAFGIAAGVAMFTVDAPDNVNFNPNQEIVGGAVLGAGIGALALGALGLILDLTVLARRRDDRSVGLSIDVTPGRAGVTASGRF